MCYKLETRATLNKDIIPALVRRVSIANQILNRKKSVLDYMTGRSTELCNPVGDSSYIKPLGLWGGARDQIEFGPTKVR